MFAAVGKFEVVSHQTCIEIWQHTMGKTSCVAYSRRNDMSCKTRASTYFNTTKGSQPATQKPPHLPTHVLPVTYYHVTGYISEDIIKSMYNIYTYDINTLRHTPSSNRQIKRKRQRPKT